MLTNLCPSVFLYIYRNSFNKNGILLNVLISSLNALSIDTHCGAFYTQMCVSICVKVCVEYVVRICRCLLCVYVCVCGMCVMYMCECEGGARVVYMYVHVSVYL